MLETGGPGLFRLMEEEGVLRLVLVNGALIDTWAMKDILRAVRHYDPIGGVPVMVEQEELVRMTPEAKLLLTRICRNAARPVAFMAYDLPERIQGDFFARFHRPGFPFRVFDAPARAHEWFTAFTTSVGAVR